MPPVFQNFVLSPGEDGSLFVSMVPPISISGVPFTFQLTKRLGGTGIVTKSMNSGFYNVSGMAIVNGVAGIASIALTAAEFSGHDPGNYAYTVQCTISGSIKLSVEGYRLANL